MNRLKRYLAVVSAVILCLAVVQAANANNAIEGNGVSLDVAVETEDEKYVTQTMDSRSVSVTARGYTGDGSPTFSDATITFQNRNDEEVQIRGNVSVEVVGASEENFAVVSLGYEENTENYDTLTTNRSYEVNRVIAGGENYAIYISSPEGEGASITLTFAPELSKIQAYNVTMGAAGAGGSYTASYDGQEYHSATPSGSDVFSNVSNDSTEGIALSAAPSDGYVFDGWYVGGKCVSASANYNYIPSGSDTTLTIAPRFLQWSAEKNAPFSVNGTTTTCYTWETAMWLAGTSGTVVVADSYTLPATLADNGLTEAGGTYVTGTDNNLTYTIPAGVTLLVPYADEPMSKAEYRYMQRLSADDKNPDEIEEQKNYEEKKNAAKTDEEIKQAEQLKPSDAPTSNTESSGRDPWTINPDTDAGAPYANRGRTDPGRSGTSVLSPVMDPDANLHRTLTIPRGTTVKIAAGGVFSVGGVMSGGGHGTVAAAGGIIGQHSNIQLDGNIKVAGVFSCNGFVLGSGSITTERGGAIYEPFVVMDFHAGSWTYTAGMVNENDVMSNGAARYEMLCPIFLRYTMPNIQTEMTIVFGAKLYGYCDLIGGSQHNVTTGMIIGCSSDAAVIQLTTESSQVVMTYDARAVIKNTTENRNEAFAWVGKSTLNITGGASYGALSIKVVVGTLEKPVSSSSFPLPLPYNVDITLADGSYAINKHFYILPGANLTVGEGADLTLGGRRQTTTPKAQIAVFRGLYEHTLHGAFKEQKEDNIIYGRDIEYRYPTTAELQGAGFSGTGGLFVNGGALTIGEYAKFGGLIQSDETGGTVAVHKNSDLTANAAVGITGPNKAGIQSVDGYFTGKTGYELRAEVASGSDTPFALVNGEHYSASDGSGILSSYTVGWYPLHTDVKSDTKTEAVKIPISGHFERAAAFTTVATVRDGSGTLVGEYDALNDALDAAKDNPGATVILNQEISNETITVTQKLTLDINGKNVKNTPITVKDGGDLTLKQVGKFGVITAGTATTMITVESGGRLALDGVTVSNSAPAPTDNATNGAVCVKNSGTIVSMRNSIITSDGGDALRNLGTIAEGVLANGNLFTGCRYAVYTTSAVSITGGTYSINSNKYPTNKGEGKTAPGRAVFYCANKTGETNISGGSFSIEDNFQNYDTTVYNAGKIGSITGGTYTGGKKDDTVFFNADNGTIEKIENVSVTGVTAAVVQNYGTITEIRGADADNKPVFSSSESETILNAGTIQAIRNCTLRNTSLLKDAVKNNGGTINSIESCEISSQMGICVMNNQNSGKIGSLINCKLTTTDGSAALSNTSGIIESISGCTIENKKEGKPAVDSKSGATFGTISGSTITGVKYALYSNGTIDKITGGCQFKATGGGTDNYDAGKLAAAVWNDAAIGEISGGCTFTATGNYGHGLFNNTKGNTPNIQDCSFTAQGANGFAFYNWGAFEDGVIQGCTFTAKGKDGVAFCNRNKTGSAKIGTLKDCTFTATGTNGDALVNEAIGSATLVQIDKIINCTATGTRRAVYNTCNSTGTGATAVINTISGGEFENTYAGTSKETNTNGTVFNYAEQGTAKIGTIQGCTVVSTHNSGNAVRNYKAKNVLTAVAEIGGIIDCNLKATYTALGNYVNSGSTGANCKAVIWKIDGGTFTATKDNAITNQNGTIELISGGSFTTSASDMRALYSKNNNSGKTGVGSTIGTISGGYFNAPNGGAVRIENGEIGAVTGGIFVAGNANYAAFEIGDSVTPKTVVSGGVFKATGNKAKTPLATGIIATGCEKSSTPVSVMLPDGTTTTGFYAVAPNNGCTITVSGSGMADVSLDGMGSGYKVTDKVTVAAPQVKGCTFNGWYRSGSEKRWSTDLVVKTTVAQMLADGLFDKNGKADLVAQYASKAETKLTLTLKGAPDGVSVTGGTPTENTNGTWNVPVGTEVTIKVNATNFRYWTNANDKVMSTQREYTFTMVTNTTLTAETSADSTFVIFQSADGRLLSAQSNLDSLKLPDAPYRVGYTFKGWKVGSADPVSADKVVEELKGKPGTVTVTAAYEAVATPCTVNAYTVVDGVESSLQSKSDLALGDIAKFTAPETSSDGSYFRFWASNKDGTNILSFSQTYSFRVTKGIEIFAIYGETVTDRPPVVRVDDVLAKSESSVNSLTFMIGANVPTGYELVEMGALYAKGSGTDEQLRVENVGTGGVLKAVSKLTQQKDLTDYSYALGFKISENNASSTIHLRGYVAVKKTGNNADDTIYYYYSGITSKSYSDFNTQQGG